MPLQKYRFKKGKETVGEGWGENAEAVASTYGVTGKYDSYEILLGDTLAPAGEVHSPEEIVMEKVAKDMRKTSPGESTSKSPKDEAKTPGEKALTMLREVSGKKTRKPRSDAGKPHAKKDCEYKALRDWPDCFEDCPYADAKECPHYKPEKADKPGTTVETFPGAIVTTKQASPPAGKVRSRRVYFVVPLDQLKRCPTKALLEQYLEAIRGDGVNVGVVFGNQYEPMRRHVPYTLKPVK